MYYCYNLNSLKVWLINFLFLIHFISVLKSLGVFTYLKMSDGYKIIHENGFIKMFIITSFIAKIRKTLDIKFPTSN